MANGLRAGLQEAVMMQELWLSDNCQKRGLNCLYLQGRFTTYLGNFRHSDPWHPALHDDLQEDSGVLACSSSCNKVPQGQGFKQQAFTSHGSVRSPRSRFLVRALPQCVDRHVLLCPHLAERDKASSGDYSDESTDPIMRTHSFNLLSLTIFLQKAPSPNTIT